MAFTTWMYKGRQSIWQLREDGTLLVSVPTVVYSTPESTVPDAFEGKVTSSKFVRKRDTFLGDENFWVDVVHTLRGE